LVYFYNENGLDKRCRNLDIKGRNTVFGRPFVKQFALCYWTVVCPVCLSVMFVHCGQTVERIKTKLGMQVTLIN